MKAVIQRVSQASVSINQDKVAQISKGLVVLLGIVNNDTINDIEWLTNKIVNMRLFADHQDIMNLSLNQINGELIVVSQFTLYASTKKGNRPSYIKAAKPDIAIPLYNKFIETIQNITNTKVQTGQFGADMKVDLTNDGPVTIIIDSKNRE